MKKSDFYTLNKTGYILYKTVKKIDTHLSVYSNKIILIKNNNYILISWNFFFQDIHRKSFDLQT